MPGVVACIEFILVVPFMCFFLTRRCVCTTVYVNLSKLSSYFSKVTTEGLGRMAPLKGVLSPVTSGMALFTIIVYVIVCIPVILPVLMALLIGSLLVLLNNTSLVGGELAPPSTG